MEGPETSGRSEADPVEESPASERFDRIHLLRQENNNIPDGGGDLGIEGKTGLGVMEQKIP